MLKLLTRLKLLATHGEELDFVVDKIRRERQAAERTANLNKLSLCLEHQQRSPGTHYSPENCDYCKLLSRVTTEGDA